MIYEVYKAKSRLTGYVINYCIINTDHPILKDEQFSEFNWSLFSSGIFKDQRVSGMTCDKTHIDREKFSIDHPAYNTKVFQRYRNKNYTILYLGEDKEAAEYILGKIFMEEIKHLKNDKVIL